jgi:hypothetical protein
MPNQSNNIDRDPIFDEFNSMSHPIRVGKIEQMPGFGGKGSAIIREFFPWSVEPNGKSTNYSLALGEYRVIKKVSIEYQEILDTSDSMKMTAGEFRELLTKHYRAYKITVLANVPATYEGLLTFSNLNSDQFDSTVFDRTGKRLNVGLDSHIIDYSLKEVVFDLYWMTERFGLEFGKGSPEYEIALDKMLSDQTTQSFDDIVMEVKAMATDEM